MIKKYKLVKGFCALGNPYIPVEIKKGDLKMENYLFLDYSITSLHVNEYGIAERKRVAEKHVTLSKQTLDRLLIFLVQENIIDNKVNTVV